MSVMDRALMAAALGSDPVRAILDWRTADDYSEEPFLVEKVEDLGTVVAIRSAPKKPEGYEG